MELVGCNICGGSEVSWSATYRDHRNGNVTYTLVRCRNCRLVYLNPRPDHSEVLAKSGEYQSLLRIMREKLFNSFLAGPGVRMMRRARTPKKSGEGGRLLDIGCATGEYLAHLRTLGWDVAGIEMDSEAAAYARDKLGIPVTTGTAEQALAAFPDSHFDVITMWHVLEHLDDAKGVLRAVRRVLKPTGRLMLEVPNFRSFWSTLLREDWFPLEYPFHRYHFTPQTLREILLRSGFEVRSLRGQAAPLETTWSLHMLSNRLRKKSWDGELLWNPGAIVALFPLEEILARFHRTNHMKAVATPLPKPLSSLLS